MVDVAMGVNGGVHRVGVPGAEFFEDPRGREVLRDIEHDDALVGGERHDVAERFDECGAVGHDRHPTGFLAEQPFHGEGFLAGDPAC